MIAANELQMIGPELALWHAFDPIAKAELFSTAVRCPRGLLLVDPIPLAHSAEDELLALGPVVGIVVSNANHWRASALLAEKWGVAVFGHASLADDAVGAFQPLRQGDMILDSLQLIEIPGAAPGEITLHCSANHGSFILGDALIHFDPYGFTLLPAKYCTDYKQMQQSLRTLLEYQFERILFAHGTPILSKARSRLEHLLNGD